MSATALMWSSSPSMLGRPSSPLNPNTHQIPGSSSPVTSPTPSASQNTIRPFHLGSGSPLPRVPTTPAPLHQTRYTRPNAKRAHSSPSSSSDIFGVEGTSPVEGAMWKEKFSRRVADKERRMQRKQDDLDRRRSLPEEIEDAEEAERRAQEDDEEIFRRLVVMQRKKAAHAQLYSHELETGGSDPISPDFWEDEVDEVAHFDDIQQMQRTPGPSTPASRPLVGNARAPLHPDDMDQIMRSSPYRYPTTPSTHLRPQVDEDEEARWAREAAEAEEAEREAEEAEMARRVEEEYHKSLQGGGHDDGMDVD